MYKTVYNAFCRAFTRAFTRFFSAITCRARRFLCFKIPLFTLNTSLFLLLCRCSSSTSSFSKPPNLPLLTIFLPPGLPKASKVPGADVIKGERESRESRDSLFQEVGCRLFMQIYCFPSLYSCCLYLIVTVGVVYKYICPFVGGWSLLKVFSSESHVEARVKSRLVCLHSQFTRFYTRCCSRAVTRELSVPFLSFEFELQVWCSTSC